MEGWAGGATGAKDVIRYHVVSKIKHEASTEGIRKQMAFEGQEDGSKFLPVR